MLSSLVESSHPNRPSRGAGAAARTLFIDRTPSADLLVGPRGRTVWPIRNDEDMAIVTRACALRDIAVREVVGRPGPAEWTRGAVGACGDAAVRDTARLYAHLTKRAYLAGDLVDLPSDAVVVTTFAALKSEFLASLYSRRRTGDAPGLICATDAVRLRRQVLVRAIFAVCPELTADLPWTAVFPTAEVDTPEHPGLRLLDSRSPAADVRAAITARSSLLAIATHSDGVDAMLAPSLAMCGISAGQLASPLEREPTCLASNHCHRFGVPVAHVAELGGVVKPAEISAGVFIFDTCFGTLAADAPINIERGLGRQLVDNPDIGALATTWELTMLDPGKLRHLMADLKTGMPLGRAIARFNRSALARRHAARLALFGDPRTRFPPRPSRPGGSARQRRGVEPLVLKPMPVPDLVQELGFSRAYLNKGIADLSAQLPLASAHALPEIKRQLAIANQTRELVRQFVENSRQGPVDDSEELRRALINDAFIRRPLDDWKAFAKPTDWRHCRCKGCGAHAWVGVVGLSVPEVSRRRVVLCPRCNLSEDMPEHVRIHLQFDAATGLCRLSGKLPRRDWSAALIVRTRDEMRNRLWEWAAAPGGDPADRMSLLELLPPGPVRLAIIMAHGGWLAWTAMDVHGGPAQ